MHKRIVCSLMFSFLKENKDTINQHFQEYEKRIRDMNIVLCINIEALMINILVTVGILN